MIQTTNQILVTLDSLFNSLTHSGFSSMLCPFHLWAPPAPSLVESHAALFASCWHPHWISKKDSRKDADLRRKPKARDG